MADLTNIDDVEEAQAAPQAMSPTAPPVPETAALAGVASPLMPTVAAPKPLAAPVTTPSILDTSPMTAPVQTAAPVQANGLSAAAAAGWHMSMVGQVMQTAYDTANISNVPDPAFDLRGALKRNGLSADGPQFADVVNEDQFYQRVKRVQQRQDYLQTIATNDAVGSLATLVTSLGSDAPIMMIPFIGGAAKIGVGFEVSRGIAAMRTAAQFAAGDALEQVGLEAASLDPPSWKESAASIATNGLLAGVARFGGPLVGAAAMGLPAAYGAVTSDQSPGAAAVNVGASILMGAMIGSHTMARFDPAEQKAAEWATGKMFTPADELKPSDFVPPTETYTPQTFSPGPRDFSKLSDGDLFDVFYRTDRAGRNAPASIDTGVDASAELRGKLADIGIDAEPNATEPGVFDLSREHTAELWDERTRRQQEKHAEDVASGKALDTRVEDAVATVSEAAPTPSSEGARRPPRIFRLDPEMLAEDAKDPLPEPFRQAASLSAAADPLKTLDEMSLAGGTFPRLLNRITGGLTPNDRAFGSLVPAEAETYFKLFDNPMLTRMADQGESPSPGGSAEGWMKRTWTSHYAPAEKAHTDAYNAMRLSGINMGSDAFDTVVGDAMRNHDRVMPHDVPIPNGAEKFIEQAAGNWREKLTNPLAERAVSLGLLSEADLESDTPDSYFRTIPDKEKLVARSDQFFAEHVPYWQGQLQGEYAASRELTNARIGKLQGRIDTLQQTPEQRLTTLAALRDRAEKLDAQNAGSMRRLAEISEATEAGNKELADQLRSSGGSALDNYVKQRAALRAERRTLGQGYGAVAEKLDRVEQRMSDQEDRATNDVTRVTSKVARKLDEIEKLDPAKHAAKIDGISRDLSNMAAKLEKITTEAETASAKARDEAASGVGLPDADMLVKHSDRMDRVATQQRARMKTMQALSDRLDAAEALDPEARIVEIRAAIKTAIGDTAKRVLDRGEQLAALKEKTKAFDPKIVDQKVKTTRDAQQGIRDRFGDRWGDASGHEQDLTSSTLPDFKDAAHDIVQHVFDKWTGRDVGDGSARMPKWAPKIERGPLKDRSYNVPERMKLDYTVRNVRDVSYNYARQMSGAIAFADRFDGQSPAEVEGNVKLQFNDLRTAIENARTDAEVNALLRRSDKDRIFNNPLDKRSPKEKALRQVESRWKTARDDIRAGTELLFGTYKAEENGSDYARLLRGLRVFSYVVEGGGFLTAHLGFLARPAMVHGLGEHLDLISNLADKMKAVNILTDEAQRSGVVLQQVLHHRILTTSEIGDPLAKGTVIERSMRSFGNVISKFNGLGIFLDTIQKHDALLTQQRILRATSGKVPDAAFLGSLDINSELAGRIGKEFAAHGDTYADGTLIPNTEDWQDPGAVRAYRSAVWKQAHITVPQYGFGDLPLISNHPLGGTMLQFQKFLLAQQQRVLMRGLQQEPTRFVAGVSAMVGIGMMIAYLKAAAAGKDRFDKFKAEMAADPKKLIYEGIEKSGVFPYLFWANGLANHVAHGNLTAALTGPVGTALDRVPIAAKGAANLASGQDVTRAQRNAIIHMTPGASLIGIRQMMQAFMGDAPWQ